MEKLELKHLAPYLSYRLKFIPTEYNKTEQKCYGLQTIYDSDEFQINGFTSKWIKPILRPLSDLTKEIEVNGEKFVPLDELRTYSFQLDETRKIRVGVVLEYMAYSEVEKLFEWHFDVFGLIDSGLAIDINTLK